MNNTPSCLSSDLLLSAIVDSSEDAILSKDLNTIITSWNKSSERVFGYLAHEMVGQPITRLFPPDRLEEEAVIMARIIKGERVEHFETVRVRKDGTRIDVSLTISPIRNSSGVVIGASKIARDITDQKRALQKLDDAYQELKRADRLKGEFLATLSHELRTPLTAILGWVQILKENATPEDVAEGIKVIERNVRLQSQLIEDLLDISRIESGKVALDIQRLDPSTVVLAAIDTIRPTAITKGIRLTSAFSSLGGVVMGDRNRLQQVVWNLLSNAVKFTPKHGKVHVLIERVHSHVEISVADSGNGIDPDFIGQVFDRFRQADSSITRTHGGLGLGLNIAKHLVELHGGILEVSSPGRGKGATFTVNLPLMSAHRHPDYLAAESRNSALDQAATDLDLKGIKVLVVDDDPDSASIVERILKRSGAEVRTGNSMEEALEAFTSFCPDVVLSDIGMPVHDGYELIARLRALPGGRSVPAVALTALARSEDRTRALRAGFQMHVAKPVDATELVAVVQNLAALRLHGK